MTSNRLRLFVRFDSAIMNPISWIRHIITMLVLILVARFGEVEVSSTMTRTGQFSAFARIQPTQRTREGAQRDYVRSDSGAQEGMCGTFSRERNPIIGQDTCSLHRYSGRPDGMSCGFEVWFPTGQPSGIPSGQPSSVPSMQPSSIPSSVPSVQPTGQPSSHPSLRPSSSPSVEPTGQPSGEPSSKPSPTTALPSAQPTSGPTSKPSALPSGRPTRQPSKTPEPTRAPTPAPTWAPTPDPTPAPSFDLIGLWRNKLDEATDEVALALSATVSATVAIESYQQLFVAGSPGIALPTTATGTTPTSLERAATECSRWTGVRQGPLAAARLELEASGVAVATQFALNEAPVLHTCPEKAAAKLVLDALVQGQALAPTACAGTEWRVVLCGTSPGLCVGPDSVCSYDKVCSMGVMSTPLASGTVSPCAGSALYGSSAADFALGSDPTGLRLVYFTFAEAGKLPTMDLSSRSFTVDAREKTIHFQASFEDAAGGQAFCRLYEYPTLPTVLDNIRSANHRADIISEQVAGFVLPYSKALTKHSIFCYAESVDGILSSYDSVMSSNFTAISPCCHQAQATLESRSLVMQEDFEGDLTVSFYTPPSAAVMTLSVSAHPVGGGSPRTDLFFPAAQTVEPKSLHLQRRFSFVGVAGVCACEEAPRRLPQNPLLVTVFTPALCTLSLQAREGLHQRVVRIRGAR